MKRMRINSRFLFSGSRTENREARSGVVFLIFIPLMLGGCFNGGYAPVTQVGVSPQQAPSRYHVKRGDTLYSIAWSYGLDYRQVAKLNHLSRSDQIWPGQVLSLKQRVREDYVSPAEKSTKNLQHRYAQYETSKVSWMWPAKGTIIQGFKPGFTGNAGLNISGFLGEPVRATAAGVVVYSGDGVRGYGNLIIIKHSDEYLSAYAFNRRNLVRVGTRVLKGQQVAVMGTDNDGKPVLHFEIRRDGKPIDPMHMLG